MVLYMLLLLPVAIVSYFIGSLSSISMASRLIFRTNLRRLGKGSMFISAFKRRFGIPGAIKLLLLEVVRDVIPIIIGGVVLGLKGHADVGRVFAGFCLVLGRLYPLAYDFRGSSATVCLFVTALFANTSVGLAVIVFSVGVLVFLRYISLATIVGALTMIIVSMLVINDNLIMLLCIFTGAIVLIRHIPAAVRLLNGKEERIDLNDDLSYKFDQRI